MMKVLFDRHETPGRMKRAGDVVAINGVMAGTSRRPGSVRRGDHPAAKARAAALISESI